MVCSPAARLDSPADAQQKPPGSGAQSSLLTGGVGVSALAAVGQLVAAIILNKAKDARNGKPPSELKGGSEDLKRAIKEIVEGWAIHGADPKFFWRRVQAYMNAKPAPSDTTVILVITDIRTTVKPPPEEERIAPQSLTKVVADIRFRVGESGRASACDYLAGATFVDPKGHQHSLSVYDGAYALMLALFPVKGTQ